MSIILNGTTGITAPAIDATLDAADLTGDVAASQITTALNATGSAPIYACRAWVNFNGTGTVAIRASGNVSSITDVGTGNYIVNFTTVMVDDDYSASGATSNDSTLRFDLYNIGSIRLVTNTATADAATVSVAIYR